MEGVGEAPTELVRTREAVPDTTRLESVVTGLGDGGSGDKDGEDEEEGGG